VKGAKYLQIGVDNNPCDTEQLKYIVSLD